MVSLGSWSSLAAGRRAGHVLGLQEQRRQLGGCGWAGEGWTECQGINTTRRQQPHGVLALQAGSPGMGHCRGSSSYSSPGISQQGALWEAGQQHQLWGAWQKCCGVRPLPAGGTVGNGAAVPAAGELPARPALGMVFPVKIIPVPHQNTRETFQHFQEKRERK